MKTAYLSLGPDEVCKEFDSEANAIEFARRLAKEMGFWEDLSPDASLEVRNEDGDVIAEIRLQRPLH